MNTTMNLRNQNLNMFGKAVAVDQGFDFVYTFLIKREQKLLCESDYIL